ncbi:MAG: LTA synthase family protein [Synergistaceae bacterium]|jgi:phosphoglycerol transferase MdoB-like AlkP superfamily enzyme|nr:LTA synthase family protein [Synergistaceae bacterium]
MNGKILFSEPPAYAKSDRGGIISLENIIYGLMIAVLWFKFHSFDKAVFPRHVLTLITAVGGLGTLLTVMAPALLIPRGARGIALVALDALLSMLILTDTLYARFYSDLFSLRNIGLSSYAWEIASSITTLFRWRDAAYFLDIPIFAALAWTAAKRDAWRGFSWIRAAAVLVMATLGAAGTAWRIYDYDMNVSGAITTLWDRPSVAADTGTLVYHAADALNILYDAMTRMRFDDDDSKVLAEWLLSRNGRRANTEKTFGAGHGKNLIMIQVESLQSFIVGLKAGNVEVAPNINRLIGQSICFPVVFSQTAAGNSSDSELMANASLYPTSRGAAFMRFASNSYRSIGTELASMGYSTVAFHGDRPGFWNRNHMYPSLGFDRYISMKNFRMEESIGLGLSDRSFFNQSMGYIRELRDAGKPFFAFLVTLTSHYPFNFKELAEQVRDIPLGDADETLVGDYIRSIAYVDEQIGNFIEALDDEGLLDESVVVLYGDHPAIPRGDHGALSSLLGRDLSSQAAWRSILSVPLVIRLPRGNSAAMKNTPAGQIDIAPSVAAIMGFSIPTAMGQNLLAPGIDNAERLLVFRSGSYIKNGVWIEQGNKTAFDMRTYKETEYSEEMARHASEAAKQLMFSDMLLEGGMSGRLKHFILRAENK